MFEKTDIELVLRRKRARRLSGKSVLHEVENILSQNEVEREAIRAQLASKDVNSKNLFDSKILDSDRIFHVDDIKTMCFDYRLRFLDSRFFKAEYPEEAISEIRRLENVHGIKLQNLKVMAPAKLLKLENADDPLLFAPMGDDFYYLIHKWGNDLHPFRKLMMWPYKSFENLVFTIFIVSILLTIITPISLFSSAPSTQEYLLLFLFVFKGVGGTVLFYGFAKGKNFNTAIWDSKFYNA
ncbi:hypothetical protein [Ulvibacter antarcticus]|uniref:Uncharacterized protein n=1 Tax=Ulvibacter antarcticus TaxID=442714 RepID=A0A3L9YHE6_9FLAO|nr:hypothetical protein [Ulvibacter antarcticus]RMA58619.1 hypothetical protein BXY75_1993 [Ulvibacter antarcticus]